MDRIQDRDMPGRLEALRTARASVRRIFPCSIMETDLKVLSVRNIVCHGEACPAERNMLFHVREIFGKRITDAVEETAVTLTEHGGTVSGFSGVSVHMCGKHFYLTGLHFHGHFGHKKHIVL